MKKEWKTYLVWIALTEAAGASVGLLTRGGVERYQRLALEPPLSPPGFIFPIVWTVLYALLGAGAARLWLAEDSTGRSQGLKLWLVQMAVNLLWPILFFGFGAFGLSLLWLTVLWGLSLWMILSFARVDSLAARLQLPYQLWLTFAWYLNLGVWLLNR